MSIPLGEDQDAAALAPETRRSPHALPPVPESSARQAEPVSRQFSSLIAPPFLIHQMTEAQTPEVFSMAIVEGAERIEAIATNES